MSRCPVRPSDVGLDPFQLSTTERTGLPQWLPEFVATFGLLITILGCVRFRPDAVALAYWFTASTSFANPAVTIARSLSDTFAGIAPWDVPASWSRRFWQRLRQPRSAAGCSREGGPPKNEEPPDGGSCQSIAPIPKCLLIHQCVQFRSARHCAPTSLCCRRA